MHRNMRTALAGVALWSAAALAQAATLDQRTLDAWNNYVGQTRARMAPQARSEGQFLWADGTPERIAQIRRGKILVAPVGASHPKRVANGLIHDWIGAAFLPNTTLAETLNVIKDYGRYKDYYQPLIVDSQALGGDGEEYRFSIVIVNQSLFSRTAIRSQCDDAYFRLDARRWYSTGSSESVREIENYGAAAERELPVGEGSGYIWRLHTVSRYEERDGGVYVEREIIVLSRDVPAAVRWVIDPMVNRLSRASLMTSLAQTRAAVLANVGAFVVGQ